MFCIFWKKIEEMLKNSVKIALNGDISSFISLVMNQSFGIFSSN